jgi:hypothetical protein
VEAEAYRRGCLRSGRGGRVEGIDWVEARVRADAV